MSSPLYNLLFGLISLCLISVSISEVDAETIECNDTTVLDRVRFVSDVNLSYDDLIRGLPPLIGERCDDNLLQEASRVLFARGIFEFVSYHIESGRKGNTLTFELIPFLVLSEFSITGNDELTSGDILRVLSLKGGTQINQDNLTEARKRVLNLYKRSGYPKAECSLNLVADRTAPLVTVEVEISEGTPQVVTEVVFEGELPTTVSNALEKVASALKGKLITKTITRDANQFTRRALFDVAYYQAGIRVSINESTLHIAITPREPVSIIVSGNNRFSDDEIVDLLQLEQRRVPLRKSTLKGFCAEVQSWYHTQGYPNASASCSFLEQEISNINTLVATITVEEGSFVELGKIKINGAKQFPTKKLKDEVLKVIDIPWYSFLVAHPLPDKQTLLETKNAVYAEYVDKGYLSAEVSARYQKVDESHSDIVIDIIENEPWYIRLGNLNVVEDVRSGVIDRDIGLQGQRDDHPVVAYIQDKFGELDGKAYSPQEIVLLAVKSEKFWRNRGYPLVEIAPRYGEVEKILDINLRVGELVTIGPINVSGNHFTHDEVIIRELEVKTGAPYSLESIEESQDNLFSLGIFNSVDIRSEDGEFDGGLEPLRVTVKERNTAVFEGLAEVSSQDGLHIQSQLAQRNLFGTGKALVLSLDGYFKPNGALFEAARSRLGFASPRILDTNLDYQLEGFFQTALELNDNFKKNRLGLSNTLKYPFLSTFRLLFSQSTYGERVYDVAPQLVIGDKDFGTTLYSSLGIGVELDKRDDPFIPSRGFRTSLDGKFFSSALGSEVDMLFASANATSLFPIGVFTYAINMQAGLYEPLGQEKVIPLGARVFLGGRDSLRGYTRYQVGPRSIDGLVVGGDTLLGFSQELRYHLSQDVVGLVFLDIAQAMLRHEGNFTGNAKKGISDLRFSPGVGAQYLTPIGPLGMEVGLATDREFGERWGRVLVSIGSAF